MVGMAMTGKYFRIDERVADEFDAWCDARRWIHQGALFEALLRYAMSASPETLVALLERRSPAPTGDTPPSVTNDDAPTERKKPKPRRRAAKGRR